MGSLIVKFLNLSCEMRKVKKYIFMGKGKKNLVPKFMVRMQVSFCVKNVLDTVDMPMTLKTRGEIEDILAVCKFAGVSPIELPRLPS